MYSDEDITAYLDGELPVAEMAAMKTAIENGKIPQARLDALHMDKAALSTAFAPLLATAPELALPVAKPRWVLPALAASVALVIGIGLGTRLQAPQSGWEMEVAHYQALYVLETLSVIEPDLDRLTQEVAKTNALLGLDMSIETLNGFEGLTLRRAQVLGFEGQVLIQIAYTMADGTPVAFCILKRQNSVEQPVSTTELLGLATATWQNSGYSFLTIGGDDPKLMADFARHLAAAI